LQSAAVMSPHAVLVAYSVSNLVALGLVAFYVIVLRSGWVRLGLVGAISFFVAIAPLGLGSAFPCSLVMAMGAILLLRRPFEHILPVELRRAWTQLRHKESVQ
jgi:hypothetical protein